MTTQTTLSYIDHSGEAAKVAFHHQDLTNLTVDTYTSTAALTALGDLKAAIDALTLLNETSINVGAKTIPSNPALPADANAQREQGLMIRYSDDVTLKKYRFTIPGVDRSLVAQSGTDEVDLANGLVAALVTAFEASYTSDVGNPVTVYAASLVGRNN